MDLNYIKENINARQEDIFNLVDTLLPNDNISKIIDKYKDELTNYSYVDTVGKFSLLELKGSIKYINKYDKELRNGGLVTKIYKNIPPREIENFSNLFRAFADEKEFDFQIVKGSDIIKYYHQDSYVTHSGSLGNSCMKYDRCSKFLELYNDNDVVSMLVMMNSEGGLIGRALLWEFDGNKVMDRIYSVYDYEVLSFKKWATDNNYIYKKEQSSKGVPPPSKKP